MLKNIEVTQDLLDYVYDHSYPLHPVQKDILNHNKTLGDIQRMQISEVVTIEIMIVVIGIFIGLQVNDWNETRKNHNLEARFMSELTAEIHREIDSLENKINTEIASALETLKIFSKNRRTFDLIFVDADKGNYINYFDLSLNLIKKNGLIIFDNVLWHGDVVKKSINDKQTQIMREFNKYIKNDRRTEKTILALGDGLTICRKL